jgi:phosphoserine/homoserine phosphotransferase
MIREADGGCLFRAPEKIRNDYPSIPCVNTYDGLSEQIEEFFRR